MTIDHEEHAAEARAENEKILEFSAGKLLELNAIELTTREKMVWQAALQVYPDAVLYSQRFNVASDTVAISAIIRAQKLVEAFEKFVEQGE